MFGAGHFSCSVSPEPFRRDRLPTGDRFREATCTDSQWRSCDLSSHLSTSEVRALSAEDTPLPLVSVCRAQKGGLGLGEREEASCLQQQWRVCRPLSVELRQKGEWKVSGGAKPGQGAQLRDLLRARALLSGKRPPWASRWRKPFPPRVWELCRRLQVWQ